MYNLVHHHAWLCLHHIAPRLRDTPPFEGWSVHTRILPKREKRHVRYKESGKKAPSTDHQFQQRKKIKLSNCLVIMDVSEIYMQSFVTVDALSVTADALLPREPCPRLVHRVCGNRPPSQTGRCFDLVLTPAIGHKEAFISARLSHIACMVLKSLLHEDPTAVHGPFVAQLADLFEWRPCVGGSPQAFS